MEEVMKKIKYLIVLALLLLTNISSPQASEQHTVDFSKKGEITVTLLETTTSVPLSGATVTIYQVAIASELNHQLTFDYVDSLSTCDVPLNDLSSPTLAENLTACLPDADVASITKVTDEFGQVTFDNLTLGLYLVSQTSPAPGYSTFDNFLVVLPEARDNTWHYSIEALPKTAIIKVIDLSVKKVWNNNNYAISDYVTINLLKGEELIDTIQLNPENNWTHTWESLPESDEYSVEEIDIPNGYQATYRFENNTFIVTNTNTLVQTGNNLLLIEFLALFGIIFIVIGIIYEKRTYHD